MNPGRKRVRSSRPRTPHRPRGFGGARRFPVWVVLVLAGLVLAGTASALDGKLDFRSTVQQGRAGDEAYRTETLREEGAFQQRIELSSRLWMQAHLRALREVVESRFGGVDSDFENRTVQPAFGVGFSTKRFRLGLNADGFRRETTSSFGPAPALERLEYGGSAAFRGEGTTRIGLRWQGVDSSTEMEGTTRQEVHERVGSFQAERSFRHVGRLRYQFSDLTNEAVALDLETTHRTHGLEYSGDTRFARDRGNIFLRARSQFFEQRIRGGKGALDHPYLLPLAGGFLLDDTPEALDPLEGERIPVPELFDRDRSAPTSIDLGDDAPAVREFGGDYRNIELDFGESVAFDSAFLYVDRVLLNPELYSWRIFATDDPEGRLWEEISPASYAIAYREAGTGLQGWEVAFRDSVTARFYKMVDVKIGPTLPNLFVTELEVFGPAEAARVETKEETNTHRVDGSVGYTITRALRVRYNGSYRQRDFTDESRNLVERSNGLTANLDAWRLLFTGQYEIHTLGSPTRQNIDVDNSLFSARYEAGPDFSTTAAWTRTLDRSSGRDKTTDNYTLSAVWRIAPALVVNHRVTEGRLDDRAEGRTSSSTALVTGVRAEPIPALSLDLERSDRWVDREAGSGFVRFNDTALTVGWSPVPNISLRSLFRYEEREESDWVIQQLLMWEPFTGGDVRPRFTLNHFRDTRNETDQKGAGIAVVWRPGPRLTIEGNGDIQELRFEGATNRPTNGGFRAVLTF